MIAFLFPGQGSQKVGMGSDLARTGRGKAAFQLAEQVLGYDLLEVCTQGPAEKLTRTLYTQPALYTVSCVLTDALAERGTRPGAVAGHSAGEYAALYAAGVVDFRTGLEIICRRAQLMDSAGEQSGGAMAAIIGLGSGEVEQLVEELAGDGVLGVAAYNTENQTVISGQRQRVESAAAEARKRGARMAKVLPVSNAFHSQLMSEVDREFAEFLEPISFREPSIPYVSNLTGKVENDPETIKRMMSGLLRQPVRWTDCLKTLASLSIEEYYEVGPGKVLSGLLKKFNPEAKMKGIESLRE